MSHFPELMPFMDLLRIERAPLIPQDDPPVLAMLHGIGSNEEDLMGVSQFLDPRLRIVSYRAPYEYGPGFSWFDIEWTPAGLRFDEDQALASVDLVLGQLRAIPAKRLFVGGFSQGAAMTLGCAFALGHKLAGALVLSGRLSESFLQRIDRVDIAGLPVLVQHGVRDEVIPPSNGRHIEHVLRQAGAEVEYREYAMGHEVSLESLQDVAGWLKARL